MTTFDDAPRVLGELAAIQWGAEIARSSIVVRDIYGRVALVVGKALDPNSKKEFEISASRVLGAYGHPPGQLIVSIAEDAASFGKLSKEPSVTVLDGSIRMIDRRLAGDEWLPRESPLIARPTRIVFYSIKGGVGRSTALAISAADFAARGNNVLVVDLDLEAPGLGSLLLPEEQIPKFGAIDWFAAIAVGADASLLLPDMSGSSPFTSSRAVVDIVPAVGKEPGDYLAKLARAYTPGAMSEKHKGFSFARKVDALIGQVLAKRPYDVVLIDARSGLHETSGSLLLGIGAKALLFGTDAPQTFDDFRLLLRAIALAFKPSSQTDLRSALKMVHAKAPRDVGDRQPFREKSWAVWSDYLYDDVEPEAELTGTPFVFDLGDEEAPHFPLEIIGDESYSRFDPRSQTYSLSGSAYEPVFGEFLAGVRSMAEQQ